MKAFLDEHVGGLWPEPSADDDNEAVTELCRSKLRSATEAARSREPGGVFVPVQLPMVTLAKEKAEAVRVECESSRGFVKTAAQQLNSCMQSQQEINEVRLVVDQLRTQYALVEYFQEFHNIAKLTRAAEDAISARDFSAATSIVNQLSQAIVSTKNPDCKRFLIIARLKHAQISTKLCETAVMCLKAALKNMNWPMGRMGLGMSKEALDTDKLNEFKKAFTSLNALNLSGNINPKTSSDPRSLAGFQIMCLMLAKRFRYHFGVNQRDKPSCQAFKPEWYLTHILNLVEDQAPFFTNHVQELIGPTYNALEGLIALLVLEASSRIKADIMLVKANTNWGTKQQAAVLLGMMSKIFAFENDLLSRYNYPSSSWGPTCTEAIERDSQTLNFWLQMERETSDSQVTEITQAPNAWELWPGTGGVSHVDFSTFEEISHMDPLKPTVSARQICELLLAFTSRIEHADISANREQFIAQVIIPVLQRYLHDITVCRGPGRVPVVASLSASSSILLGDGVMGIAPKSAARVGEQEGAVLGDLWTHCALVNSCNYCVYAMEDWSSYWVFLDMAPQSRKTTPASEDSIFASVTNQYLRMRKDLLKRVISKIQDGIPPLMELYFRHMQWRGYTDTVQQVAPNTSPVICEIMRNISIRLEVARCALAQNLFQKAWPSVLQSLNNLIFGKVLTYCQTLSMSDDDGKQFTHDMECVLSPFALYTSNPMNITKEVKDTCTILSAPTVDLFPPNSSPDVSAITALTKALRLSKLGPENVKKILSVRSLS
ncbi:RAD50-interacting protein 1 [Pelomyxa schiedti]|nr:RAD50-interacting protein 1 [Pelomyxa schiedti]